MAAQRRTEAVCRPASFFAKTFANFGLFSPGISKNPFDGFE
jgi:hypothetical protein